MGSRRIRHRDTSGHFEEASAGIFRRGEALGQDAAEGAEEIGQLGGQIQQIEKGYRRQKGVQRHRGEPSGRSGPGLRPLVLRQGHRPGVDGQKQEKAEQNGDDELGGVCQDGFSHQALEGGVGADEQGDNEDERRNGQQQAQEHAADAPPLGTVGGLLGEQAP